MKTAIYNKVKRLAALLLVGGAMTSNIVAQENLHLFYRNGDHQKIEITDDIKVEFVKESYIIENNYSVSCNNDTIFLSASAGNAAVNCNIESNVAWQAEDDADWLMAYTTVGDSMRENYGLVRYNNYLAVSALPNASSEQRTATLTLKTEDGKAQRQFTVVQQPYVLSFEKMSFVNIYRYDGEPVLRDTVSVNWNDMESYHYLMPNHGVSVVSQPEWMELDTITIAGEAYSFAWQKENVASSIRTNTVVRFRFSENLNATSRSGEVVFEGSNGQRVTSLVVQEGLNEISVLKSAADLHQGLYDSFIVGVSNHNDFGLPAMMLFLESRGADMVSMSTGYNWFSNALDYTDLHDGRYPTHIAWRTLYYNIKEANSIIAQYAQNEDPLMRAYLAQAYALRAFDYFYLAQIYSHTYVGSEEALCIPLVTEENMEQERTSGIPRATVSEVYDYILENLNKAILLLEGNTIAYPDKELMSLEAAYALRARVYLVMNKWKEAAADAQAVIDAKVAVPYSIEQVSKPGFYDISDAAWLWGIKVEETDNVVATGLVNWPSHMCSLVGYGYTTGIGSSDVHKRISKALWVSIPRTDVRKGWWVDENLQSPLLVNAYGEDMAAELPYAANMAPFTNVKFGPEGGEPLNSTNAQDIPLIRIEEVYLILAEAQAMAGDVDDAVNTLNSFVSTYRDPAYDCTAATAEEVQEAVWQQRRIELWGEGLAYYDLMRLKKATDRRGAGFEPSYVFNIPDGDATRIYQIPSTEMSSNVALVQNPEYTVPSPVEDIEVSDEVDDFVYFADGVYSSLLFGAAWEQVMEASQSEPNLYRLPGYIAEGYDLKFYWDSATGAVALYEQSWETGYVHSQYGMVTASAEAISYDAATMTFSFTINYHVSEGTFGTYVDTYTINHDTPSDPNEGQWKSLGMATYTEDVVASLFGVENLSYEIEVQEHIEQSGLYRLVNPYGPAYEYSSLGNYDDSENHYLVINAQNPNAVYVELSYTGFDLGDGEIAIWSMADYYMSNGKTADEVAAYFGKLENGVITFPAKALVAVMGDNLYYANNNGKFSVVLPGYEVPQIPTELYMIGQDFGAWDWSSDGVVAMTPVHSHEGAFWATRYFTAGNGFKFCSQREWNGDFYVLDNNSGYIAADGNCYVEEDGFYTVYVDVVNSVIAVEPAAVYGIGECFGGWDVNVESNKFVADGSTLVSPVAIADANLRMYAAAPSMVSNSSIDWWQMEFNVYDGAIVYRGNGGDLEEVPMLAGQQVVLDLNANTGAIVEQGEEDIYLAEVKYSSYNNDTIFMSASAGRTNSFGWVYCNRPWTVNADADWLMVRKNESDMYDSNFTSGYEYEDIFMIYADANETEEERVAHVTIATEDNVSKTYVVVQRPYTLSFNEMQYTNGFRFDGEAVDTVIVEGSWNYDYAYYNLYPNHGWEVTSYPDWMTMDEFVHGANQFDADSILAAEDILSVGQPIVSTAVFRFSHNESPEAREAHIVFEGHGQKVVGIFRQEGNNEQTIVNAAEALAKKMYVFDEALGMGRHNDFGFPALMLGMDSRGIDMVSDDNGYNWFTGGLTYSDLGSNLVYTAMYWSTMYSHINACNEVIRAYDDRSEESLFQFYLAQAYTFRAFNYFYLAQLYQQTYVGNEEALCVPIIHAGNMDDVNVEGCPRATVRQVYDFILSDLERALDLLQKTDVVRPSKQLVSQEVVYGLRARVNMVRGEWKDAAEDAQRVIASGVATPYTMEQVSKPSFSDVNDVAWLWGLDVNEDDGVVQTGICNWPSHMGSFSAGYAQVGAWRRVSQSLYNAIPVTDVRQGWFLDAQCSSANLNEEQQVYVNNYGMPAYTQVKFAPYNNVLETNVNANDIPLMRIEEMYLILAEAQAMVGNVAEANETLNNFVVTYRDYAYANKAATPEEVQEAVWMQRRIEFWGEGISYFDLMRLGKGVDRRGAGFAEEYTFNIPAGDAALIYPIPDRELNKNPKLEQNPVAEKPQPAESAWMPVAAGIYNYTLFFGGNVGYDLYRNVDASNNYRIKNWARGVNFTFTLNEDGSIHVAPQPIGYTHQQGEVYVMDVDDYAGEMIAPSYYDEESRTFYFGLVYYIPEVGAFPHGYETFVLTEEQAAAISRASERKVTTPEVNVSLTLTPKVKMSHKLGAESLPNLAPIKSSLKTIDACLELK